MSSLTSALARSFWLVLLALAGCNLFDAQLERRISADGGLVGDAQTGPRECRTHADCADRDGGPFACVQESGACVALTTPECATITGDLSSPNTIVLGSLFSVSGAQGATNLPRQQSAILAIEALNRAGGVPGPNSTTRPLLLLSCDEAANLDNAATHLIDELKVPAIVGPNVSQDVIDVTGRYSAAGGSVLISPTAVASSITDLVDDNLTWVMVPSDEQRAPLMRQQINDIEKALAATRKGVPVKLSVIYRDDALGHGTLDALDDLVLNGMPLAQNVSANVDTIRTEPYQAADPDMGLVDRQVKFAPDIIVMAGLAEAITQIMVPLEAAWGAGPRPTYILIDSLKVPELLSAAAASDDLRKRVRGTGIVPTDESAPIYSYFQVAYSARFPGSPNTISGMGPAYDATYAIAYALAATQDMPVSGASVAAGLAKLGQGGMSIELEANKITAAFRQLSMGEGIDAIGTFAPLAWDARGAPIGGRVEIWCIASGATAPTFASSGLTLDLATQTFAGSYSACN